jgi:hypothetical protein
MNLCPYKYILGVPGKGIHQYRFFGVAIVDTVQTIIGAALLAYLFKWSFWLTLLGLFLLGEILHYIFCVPTTVMKTLFPKEFPTY